MDHSLEMSPMQIRCKIRDYCELVTVSVPKILCPPKSSTPKDLTFCHAFQKYPCQPSAINLDLGSETVFPHLDTGAPTQPAIRPGVAGIQGPWQRAGPALSGLSLEEVPMHGLCHNRGLQLREGHRHHRGFRHLGQPPLLGHPLCPGW